MKKKIIAKLFMIKEENISFEQGIKDHKTLDTYTFHYGKIVSLLKLTELLNSIPDIRKEDSIITEGKIVLRVRN